MQWPMSKHQMIDAIRQRNRSARPEFLLSFNEQTLEEYLRRLTELSGHRGKATKWVRQTAAPAVTMRLCA